MELLPDSRVSPHPDVAWRLVEGEVVLLNVMTGQYYSLDAIGSHIWTLLAPEGSTPAALRDRLLAEFDATAEQIERDLTALFDQLAKAELIVTA